LEPDGVLAHADTKTLLVDSSTIDFDSARVLHAEAVKAGFRLIDGPVSGGVSGAEAATLTFMLGGTDEDVAEPAPSSRRWPAISSTPVVRPPARPRRSSTT